MPTNLVMSTIVLAALSTVIESSGIFKKFSLPTSAFNICCGISLSTSAPNNCYVAVSASINPSALATTAAAIGCSVASAAAVAAGVDATAGNFYAVSNDDGGIAQIIDSSHSVAADSE